MIRQLGLSALLLTMLTMLACDVVPPSNPFDPATPADRQFPATLRGAIVLDDSSAADEALAGEFAEITVTVLDETGRPRTDAAGDALVLPLTVAGRRGAFATDELVPGTIRLAIAGVGARFTPPTLSPIELTPGAIVDVGDLAFTFRPAEGGGPGRIDGEVVLDGGSGGERTVGIFRRDDAGQTLVTTTVTNARGAFSVAGLPVGTYAVSANLEGFTPDYRVDVAVGEGAGQALAHTFSGADALTLHPVTAVLLPQLDRVDGTFYTRGSSVPLAVLAFGGVTGMRLQAVACDQPAPACADVAFADDDGFAEYSATVDQALPDVEGRVGLFAQFEARSAGGFTFTSPVFLSSVVRDVTPPALRAVSVLGEGPAAEVIATDDSVNFVVDVDDTGGVAAIGHVLADNEPAATDVVFTLIAAAPGAASIERTVALPATDGRSTAWFFVKDRAGNVSPPSRVDIVKDTAPAAELPLLIDAVVPREGRVVDVVVSFDTTGALELPVELQLAAGALPPDTVTGRVPFVEGETFTVTTSGQDGETLLVRGRLFDAVGNVTPVQGTTVLSLRGAIAGTIGQERLGAAQTAAGTLVTALGADGRTLATTTTNAAGAYSLPSLPEGRVTLQATAAGYRPVTLDAGFLEADALATLDSFLALRRGSLVGTFRRADLDTLDDRHGGINVEVRLISQTRSAAPRPAVTGASGDWALDLVPATLVGESYDIVAVADGYATGLAQDVTVDDNALTVVLPDGADPGTPTPVLLAPLSGDFDLCSTAQAGGACAALAFTNGSAVRVHLRDDDGVTRIRAAAGTLPAEAELPLATYDADVDVVVALPNVQGSIAVFAEVERDGGRQTLGPVFVFRDTVRPAAPEVVIARGAAARRDGFTNQPFVAATVTLDPADDDDRLLESPLVRAPTFFDDVPPTEPRAAGVAFCSTDVACTVLLPSLGGLIREQRHDLFAFACDAAGNCSAAPGASAIVYDETPPSGLHGVSLAPTGAGIVDLGSDDYRTGSGAYAVAIDVGTARSDDGTAVLDVDGLPVRDVDAVALSFVAAIDDDDVDDIVGASDPDDIATIAGLPLLGGEATYDLFARFVDAAGNATAIEPNPFTFTLTLDETAPTGRLVLQDGANLTNSQSVAARIDAISESNVRVKIVTDAADCQVETGYVAAAALPPTTDLQDADGAQLVLACLQDDVGNLGVASDTITLDRVAPSGSVVIDGGAAFSSSRNLVAAFQAVSSDVARVKAVLRPAAASETDCADPTGYVAFASSVALSLGVADPAGTYAVDACFEDAAGNRASSPATDTIQFDTTSPLVTIELNSDEAFTTSSEVRARIEASNTLNAAFVGMRFSSSLTFSGNREAFAVDRAGLVLSAPTVEGSKTVCVEVEDDLGRTATDCDDIVLDLSAPAGTLTAPAFATTSPFDVSIRSDDLNIESAAVGEGLDCGTATFATLARSTTVTRSVTLADTTTTGSRTVVACFKDAAGQVARVERTVSFDPTDPPLAQAIAPADGAVVPTRRPAFAWAAVEGAIRYTLIVRRVTGGVVALTQANLTGLSFTPTADLPEAPLEWIVVATRASGRSSVQSFTGAPRVTPDVTAPTAATALTLTVDTGRSLITSPAPCAASSPCLNDNTPRVAFTAGTDVVDTSVAHTVQITTIGDTTFNAPLVSIARADGTAFELPPLEDGSYRLRVRSVDDVGNAVNSAESIFSVDRAPPDTPSFLPLQSPLSSTRLASVDVNWTAEGPSGAVAYRFQLTTDDRTFANPIVNEVLSGAATTRRDVKSVLVTGGNVVHQVRVAAIDALGNQSPFAVAAFTNDTTAPCADGATLTILGTDATNGFTDSAAVVVEVSCQSAAGESGPSLMQLGCDGVAAGKPRVAFNGFSSCVLPGVDGTKTAAAVVIDAAGNETTAFTDTIVLDRRVPTTPVLSIDEEITNNLLFSFSILESSTDTNFLRHEFMDGVEITTFDDPRAIVVGTTVALALIDERSYNVRVRGVDRAGNASPEAIATVVLDTTPPTRPDIADNDGPVVVNDDTFTFFLQAPSTDVHFDRYEISTNGGAFVPAAGDGVFTVPLPQNTTTSFAVRGVDRAGNVGDADVVTAIEDSRNPRPVALADLPAITLAGPPQAFATPTFSSRGAYVDVHFARSEIDVSPGAIDSNFDHFEVRAPGSPAFLNFVPLCATPTPLCPATVRTDVGIDVVGADHLILAGTTIVGFRIPVARGEVNAISVRSVDRAGNTSVETTVRTTEASISRATNDDLDEVESSLFGDRFVTILAATEEVIVREPGPDARLGTDDDLTASLGQAINVVNSVFEATGQVIAQAPDLIARTANNGGVSGVFATTAGIDHSFTDTSDNFTFLVNNDILVPGDESLAADQPSAWGSRIAFRRTISGTDTDILVRDPGNNGRFGDSDDRLTVVADDPVFQRFPQLSGENLAFFRCVNANCDGIGDPALVVVNSGGDRRFGTGDDIVQTLPQAVGVDPAFPPRLFTPGTPGRAACKNVVAWAGDSAHKGIHVVSTGPDGLFDADDTPVQVMNTKAQGGGNMRGFALHDDIVVAADGFAPPFLEVATGGRDGCLTRTADNLTFDTGINSAGTHHAVHDGRIVTTVFSPTHDVVILDLNVTRQLWTRNEGQGTFANFDADVDGVSLGGGGVYDFAARQVQTAFAGGNDDADLNRGTVLHGPSSVFIPGIAPVFDTLRATERGIDGVWGTADDRTTALTATHPLSLDNNAIMANSVTHSLDGDIAVWAGRKTDDSVVPVLRFAGVDGAFGIGNDDCEVELSTVAEPGYKFVRSSQRRQAFQHCADFGCGNVVGAISVREVTGDVCTGPATTEIVVPFGNAPDIDGRRLVFLQNGVHVVEPGPDGRLTTTADNTDTLVSLTDAIVSEAPRISGDRVVWVDARTETPRVVVADLADGSERVVAPTVPASTGVSIEGDLIVFGTEIAGESFLTDVAIAHLGLQPDLPADARNPAPTRQRCPDDDVFEENDSDLTATAMNSGASVNAIVCRGDDDRFRINVPAVGCVVRAKARFIHAEGDVDMTLLDPNGTQVAQSLGSSNDESIAFTAVRAGDHVVRAFGFNGAENSYDLGVTVTCP